MQTSVTNFTVSKIKNIWFRRFVMVLTLPFLYVINIFLLIPFFSKLVWFAIIEFIRHGLIQSEFFQSAKQQWEKNDE